MTTSYVNNDLLDNSYLYRIETGISCLNEKIHSVMRKINLTCQNLEGVSTRLYFIDPFLMGDKPSFRTYFISIVGYLKYIFSGSMFTESISMLLAKKSYFEFIRRSQHRELNHLEKMLKIAEKDLDEYRQSHNLTFDSYHQLLNQEMEALPPGDLNKEWVIIEDVHHGITLTKALPVGVAVNPDFILRQERAKRIFEKAMSCMEIKELYIEAMLTRDPETGETEIPWTLLLTNHELSPIVHSSVKEFGASCSSTFRTIYINPESSDDAILSSFVFELTNAISSNEMSKIWDDARAGKIGREAFAKAIELSEYEGSVRHYHIMKKAIKSMGWSSITLPPVPFNSFELEWSFCKNSRHTEAYREHWDDLQRNRLLESSQTQNLNPNRKN